MRLQHIARSLVVLALLAVPAAARAQLTVYTDLASFLAATSNAGTDRFDDLAGSSIAGPLNRSAGSHGYVATVNTTDFYGVGSAADRWLSANTATDIITFDGFGSSVRGVGGFFFGSDFDGLFRAGTDITVSATDATGTTTQTILGATTGSFLGFVSAGEITSLSVEAVLPPNDLAWPTVNDLVIAESVSAVPEPSTFAILGTGLMGLLLVARRRQRG